MHVVRKFLVLGQLLEAVCAALFDAIAKDTILGVVQLSVVQALAPRFASLRRRFAIAIGDLATSLPMSVTEHCSARIPMIEPEDVRVDGVNASPTSLPLSAQRIPRLQVFSVSQSAYILPSLQSIVRCVDNVGHSSSAFRKILADRSLQHHNRLVI